jgi:hypothetical protein
VRSGIAVRLIPALTDITRFGNLLQVFNPPIVLTVRQDGNLQLSQSGVLFAARPALFSSTSTVQGQALGGRFEIGTDGLLRFVTVVASGSSQVQTTQVINPAVHNLTQFTTALKKLDAGATVAVQSDGKLALSLGGARYTLTPDYGVVVGALADLFAGSGGSGEVDFALKDGKVFIKYPFGFVQGFAVALP